MAMDGGKSQRQYERKLKALVVDAVDARLSTQQVAVYPFVHNNSTYSTYSAIKVILNSKRLHLVYYCNHLSSITRLLLQS